MHSNLIPGNVMDHYIFVLQRKSASEHAKTDDGWDAGWYCRNQIFSENDYATCYDIAINYLV